MADATPETTVPDSCSTSAAKRNRMGRRERKRRKKYNEIEAAAAIAAGTNDNGIVTTTSATSEDNITIKPQILPTDRGYIQDHLQELVNLSDEDKHALIRQLGYLPGNTLKVVSRVKDVFSQDCFVFGTGKKDDNNSTSLVDEKKTLERAMNEPLVIKLYPLVLRDETDGTKTRRKRRRRDTADSNTDATTQNDEAATTITATDTVASPLMEPFPTIYWTTHPRIKDLVSKLEQDKMGTKYEQILQDETTKSPNSTTIVSSSSSSKSSPLDFYEESSYVVWRRTTKFNFTTRLGLYS